MEKSTPRPSAGTVLGAIGAVLGFAALVISLSGIAVATPSQTKARASHFTVHRGDIAPGAVTSKTIASGAVTTRKLAEDSVNSGNLSSGSVNRRILRRGAVIATTIAPDAVSAGAIAPGSIYGGALGEETIHTTPIADLDKVASNPEWTEGNTEVALCGAGERLLSGGFAFTEVGNREVSFLQALPFVSPTTNGVAGAFASNSGGGAKGEVVALCLK